MSFSELVRVLQADGFQRIRETGSVRYDAKDGWPRLVRVDSHGSRQVPTGTLHAIFKSAGIDRS